MSASPAIQSEPQDLVSLTKSAGASAKALAAEATRRVRTRILGTDGRIDAAKLESQQHAAHGLAWLAWVLLPVSQSSVFWGYFFVAGLLFVMGGLAGYLAARFFKSGQPPVPAMAIDEAQKIKRTFRKRR